MSQWIYQKGEKYSLGSALKKLRKRRQLTQDQVAGKLQVMGLDVSRAAYSKMETGNYGIRLDVLIGLKIVFKAEYSEFFIDLP